MSLSLRDRLLVSLLPLVLVGLLATDVATTTALSSFLSARLDAQLLGLINPAKQAVLPGQSNPGFDDHGRGGPPSDQVPGGTYTELLSPAGVLISEEVLGSYNRTITSRPQLPSRLPNAGPDVPTILSLPGTGGVAQYRTVIESLDQAGGDFLVIAIPLTDIQGTVQQLMLVEGIVGVLVLLVMALTVVLIVRYSLRPLERIADTAQAIASGDLTRRVEIATPRTEIGRLGLALNLMLSQLERAFSEQLRSEQRLRRFVADASHELRTPLTSIRGYAELLGKRGQPAADAAVARRRIHQESVRMSVLVDDLLLLARLDQGRPLEQAPVDLAGVVRDACSDARVVAADRAVTVDVTGATAVIGDEMRLRQVIGNLVRNALVHTPPGSPIEVTVGQSDQEVQVRVADHGPGIPEGEVGRLFEPFFRADAGRSRDRGGSGLGLSIVAAVVGAHGGRVRVENTPGGGATFVVELPIDPAAPQQTLRQPTGRAEPGQRT